MTLKQMDDESKNEIERKEKAIRLCMKHVMDQSEETFQAMTNRFEDKNKGYGYDLYLKPEHHKNFKGSNVNIGLIEVQNYMVESAAANMKAERLGPKELFVSKSIEDWYNTLGFLCAHPEAKFQIGPRSNKIRQAISACMTMAQPGQLLTLTNSAPIPNWGVKAVQTTLVNEVKLERERV